MKKIIIISAIAIGLMIVNSCKDQYDFSTDNMSEEIIINADMAIPLIDASFTLDELIPDSSNNYIVIDEDNFISLVYEDDIIEVTAFDFFDGTYTGTLEEINYTVTPQIFQIGMDKLLNQGEFYIANPSVTLSIKNYWNIPVQFKFTDFYYYEDAFSEGIPVTGSFIDEWHDINPPKAPDLFAMTDFLLDASNSNIDELLSSMPNHLSFGAILETTPGQAYDVDGNTTDSARLKIEIPLDLRISNLNFIDTMEINGLNELGSDTAKVESVQMNLIIENGFPVSIDAQVYFADEDYTILDSISTEQIAILPASVTDGKVSAVTKSTNIIYVEGIKLQNLLNSKFLIPRIIFNTTGHELGETVKFYSDYQIGLKIGALSRLKL